MNILLLLLFKLLFYFYFLFYMFENCFTIDVLQNFDFSLKYCEEYYSSKYEYWSKVNLK